MNDESTYIDVIEEELVTEESLLHSYSYCSTSSTYVPIIVIETFPFQFYEEPGTVCV